MNPHHPPHGPQVAADGRAAPDPIGDQGPVPGGAQGSSEGRAAMKPGDVPDELRNIAREAFAGRPADAEGTLALPVDRNPWRALDDALAAVMAAVLPAHEAMVRAKVAAEIEELRVRLLNRPSSQRPDAVDAVWEAREITRGGE